MLFLPSCPGFRQRRLDFLQHQFFGSGTGAAEPSTVAGPADLTSRAFVSNPLNPSGVGGSFNPVLNIVDAAPGIPLLPTRFLCPL